MARRFGMSQEVCTLHGETLQEMKYFVPTALGISKGSYTNTMMIPIHGTGQGSCASPLVWLQICLVLFDCHEAMSHGATFSSPNGAMVIQNSMVGYVDDTKGITNYFHAANPIPTATLTKNMQEDAQLWGDLLHTSRGTLEIPECNFYRMQWDFTDDGIPTLNESVNTNIRLETGERDDAVILLNDSVMEALKTLGCWKSAGKVQKKEEMVLNNYARTILASNVTRRDN
jgi:hypothetical protein